MLPCCTLAHIAFQNTLHDCIVCRDRRAFLHVSSAEETLLVIGSGTTVVRLQGPTRQLHTSHSYPALYCLGPSVTRECGRVGQQADRAAPVVSACGTVTRRHSGGVCCRPRRTAVQREERAAVRPAAAVVQRTTRDTSEHAGVRGAGSRPLHAPQRAEMQRVARARAAGRQGAAARPSTLHAAPATHPQTA